MAAVRFCSACGVELASRPPVTCTACGTSHWLNPKPCANTILVDGGKVLLVRRGNPDSPWHGSWCAPGGFCEVGEHPVDTAVRETREETGYRIEVGGYLGTWVDVYADDPSTTDAETINVSYYSGAIASSDAAVADPAEVSEVAWFAWDELPADLAPPGTLRAVLEAATTPERIRPR